MNDIIHAIESGPRVEENHMKVAFLDRDGTIIKDYPDEVWKSIKEPEFLGGSIEGMKRLQDAGYKLVIVTNQYLINEGIIDEAEYVKFTSKLLTKFVSFGVDVFDIFYCPHKVTECCNCFKPKTGLIEQAIKKYPSIELETSIMVGDSICDLELAEKMDLDFYGIAGGSINEEERLFQSINGVANELLSKTSEGL